MRVRDVKTRQIAPLATPTGLSSRTKIAGLITLAGFSLTMLLTGMERAMANSTDARRVVQVEHITIKTTKKFAEVEAALERSVPQLDPAVAAALANGNEQRDDATAAPPAGSLAHRL